MKTYYKLTSRDTKNVNWMFPFWIIWAIGFMFLICSDNRILAMIYFGLYFITFFFFIIKLEKRKLKK